MSNICIFLVCLLLPLLIGLFRVESTLYLSSSGHTAVELLIILGIYGLLMQIIRLDQWLYLRSSLPAKRRRLPEPQSVETHPATQDTSPTSDRILHRYSTWQTPALSAHPGAVPIIYGVRAAFTRLFNNHRQATK